MEINKNVHDVLSGRSTRVKLRKKRAYLGLDIGESLLFLLINDFAQTSK
jgi:hypothetical protein